MEGVHHRMTDPCSRNSCVKCCCSLFAYVSEADIARIEAIGRDRRDFLEEVGEYRLLVMIDSHCIFLEEDRCSIYPSRPDICKPYPVVVLDLGRPELDVDCPYRDEFEITPELVQLAIATSDLLESEAASRRGNED